MRKHFYHIFTWMLSVAMFVASGMQALASDTQSTPAMETEAVVDTITLDSDLWDYEIPVDLSWKTKQDKGQWIEELGIGEGVNSLVLVINNLDKGDPEALPKQEVNEAKNGGAGEKEKKPVDITGKSRLVYFSQNEAGEWEECFAVDGFISGDATNGKEVTYGVYTPNIAFGIKENPGSLLPYQRLTSNDYWILNPESEAFGDILTVTTKAEQPSDGIKMENLKTFCNYGMILKPELEGTGYPALVFNCLQLEKHDGTFCGLQIPEQYMRMLVQSLDDNTRVIISDSLDRLEEISKVIEE